MDAARGREEACVELLYRLQPLIISSVKKYYNKMDEMDDLIQEGRLEILLAVVEYSKDYSVPFLGYIKSRLKYLYLGKNRLRRELSLNVQVGEDGQEHIQLLEDDQNIEGDYVRMEQEKEILSRVASLPKRERQVVEGYYFQGLSIGEISRICGITYRTVINTKKRAVERLRKEMEEDHV